MDSTQELPDALGETHGVGSTRWSLRHSHSSPLATSREAGLALFSGCFRAVRASRVRARKLGSREAMSRMPTRGALHRTVRAKALETHDVRLSVGK
jgi:hypothetical protein